MFSILIYRPISRNSALSRPVTPASAGLEVRRFVFPRNSQANSCATSPLQARRRATVENLFQNARYSNNHLEVIRPVDYLTVNTGSQELL